MADEHYGEAWEEIAALIHDSDGASLQALLETMQAPEIARAISLLGEEAALYSDGGGKATAVPKVLADRAVIAKFFIGISRQGGPARGFFETQPTHFNGAPGVLILSDGKPVTALCLEIANGKIVKIFAHRNPDKLRSFEN